MKEEIEKQNKRLREKAELGNGIRWQENTFQKKRLEFVNVTKYKPVVLSEEEVQRRETQKAKAIYTRKEANDLENIRKSQYQKVINTVIERQNSER